MTDESITPLMGQVSEMTRWVSGIAAKFTDAANLVNGTMPTIVAKAPMGRAVNVAAELSSTADELELALKKFRGEIAKVKEVYLPERFDNEEVKTFNTDEFRITKLVRTFASVIGEQADAFEWLRNNGYEGLIKETVNSSSLSAAAKELMENGKELPDETFKVYNKNGVSITAKKPARG